MPTFEHSIVVRGDAESLFALMQDYAWRLRWDPFLSEARLLDADRAAVGVRALCVDRAGRAMETEYVTFSPPSRAAVRRTRGPWMFRAFAASWRYRPVGPADDPRTEVVFRYHVEARPHVPMLTDPLLRVVFSREMRRRLVALQRILETTDLLAEHRRRAAP